MQKEYERKLDMLEQAYRLTMSQLYHEQTLANLKKLKYEIDISIIKSKIKQIEYARKKKDWINFMKGV